MHEGRDAIPCHIGRPSQRLVNGGEQRAMAVVFERARSVGSLLLSCGHALDSYPGMSLHSAVHEALIEHFGVPTQLGFGFLR